MNIINLCNMKTKTVQDARVSAKYSSGQTLPVFVKTSGNATLPPFTAWLAGATGDEVYDLLGQHPHP